MNRPYKKIAFDVIVWSTIVEIVRNIQKPGQMGLGIFEKEKSDGALQIYLGNRIMEEEVGKKWLEKHMKAFANMHIAESNLYVIGLKRLDFVAENKKTLREVMIRGRNVKG